MPEKEEEVEVKHTKGLKKKPSAAEVGKEIEKGKIEDVREEQAKVAKTEIEDPQDLPVVQGPRIKNLLERREVSREFLEEFSSKNPGIPFIGFKRYTPDRLGWTEMSYPDLAGKPSVIVLPEHREGWFDREDLFSPEFISNSKVANKAEGRAEKFLKDAFGDWSVGFSILGNHVGISFNWLRDSIVWAMSQIAYITGYVAAWLGGIILEIVAANATEAVYTSIEKLHDFSRRPKMQLTTAELKEVTTNSAKFLGYEGVPHNIVVIGTRRLIG